MCIPTVKYSAKQYDSAIAALGSVLFSEIQGKKINVHSVQQDEGMGTIV